MAGIRRIKEAREAIRLSVRRFAEEAGVSTRTLQDHEAEGGRIPRRDVAEKYAAVLRRYGVDPLEVREVAEGLGEVFTVGADPYWRLWLRSMRAWEELTVGFVRDGHIDALREHFEKIEAEYGEEGRRNREQAEAEHQRLVDEEQKEEG